MTTTSGDAAGQRSNIWDRRWPFLLWAVLALIFVGGHYHFYFQQPFYEGGDFAANALQIRQAKALHEIYGNYSRFGFHHPGPAFFYAYAAGERLLFDLLKVVPAPFNAHAIVGVFLQLAFFVWALRIVQKRVPKPLIVPLLLLFAAIHFGTVNYFLDNTVFQSIWPPDVLLMPFLCFLVACASVAAGDATDLVALALSGSMLVHGHVAQPLFVVPLAALAYGAWHWRRRRDELPKRGTLVAHAWAAGIIALFVLPIAIDALQGERSNLALILRHFAEHSAERKSFAQSALYYAAFFCHVENPEKFCDHLTSASFEFLRTRWHFLFMWAVVFSGAALLLKYNRKRASLPDEPFVRWLVTYFAAASALTLIWGKIQNDAMFEFNSHFNFAILFVPFILLAIGISSLPVFATAVRLRELAFVGSLPLLFFASRNFKGGPDFPRQPIFTPNLHDEIRAAARRDRQPSRTKLLLFAPDDWGEAVRVALELERSKYRYRVDQAWDVIFGRGRGVDIGRAFSNPNIAIWNVTSAGSGAKWLTTDLKAIDPTTTKILFATPDENAHEFVTWGWEISKGPFSWSVSKTAVLRFTALHTASDVRIVAEVAPSSEWQPVVMTFSEGPSKTFGVTQPTRLELDVPADVWNAQATAMLKFYFPEARSPLSRRISEDPRELGCAFTEIDFRTAPETPRSP